MFTLFLTKLKVILKNPMILFIYAIISKWYIMVMVTAVVVTYYVFQGLTNIGFFEESERIVSKAFRESKSIAKYCVPKILKFSDFWNCLEHPPEYKPSNEEEQLEKGLTDLLNVEGYEEPKTPYKKGNTPDPYGDIVQDQ